MLRINSWDEIIPIHNSGWCDKLLSVFIIIFSFNDLSVFYYVKYRVMICYCCGQHSRYFPLIYIHIISRGYSISSVVRYSTSSEAPKVPPKASFVIGLLWTGHIDGLVKDCSNCSALAMLLQSCTESSILAARTTYQCEMHRMQGLFMSSK